MGDSAAGTAAFLAGEEIVNDERTLSYLNAGYGPSSLQVNGCCTCPRIRELIECDSDPYISPALDPAPWYDSSVPESGDFAGFLSAEFQGLGSTFTRTPVEKITGGAVLGRLQPKPRALTWKGFLFGRSDCAVRYGLSWLTAQLKGQGCYCGGEDLDLLICCPELTESPPVSGCVSLPPINRPEPCPPYSQPDAFRTLKNVGLIEGPVVVSQRRVGCSCGSGDCSGEDTLIMEVEFALLAGNPYLYGCPVCLCIDQSFPSVVCFPIDPVNPIWKEYSAADVIAQQTANTEAGLDNPLIVCSDECPPLDDCSDDEKGCPKVVLPNIPEFVDGCFCPPLIPVQTCCEVPADSFGNFFEGAPIIEIYSGSSVMRSTTVRFYDNPQGLECCDVAENPCRNCDSVQIRYIPKDSTLTIDGTTRTVYLKCPGQVDPIPAEHLTVTPFAWPILQCVNFCICTETDGATVADNATVTVLISPREM